MPSHVCNYTSQLSSPSGLSVYKISGTSGHSFAFSGRLPSTYGINTPFVGATLVSSLSVSETTNKFPERLLFAINFSCCLLKLGIFFLFGTTTYLCFPTNWTRTFTLVYLALDLSIAPKYYPGSIPGSGRGPEEGNGYPFQYSCLEYPMDRGPWQATVHGFTKSQT